MCDGTEIYFADDRRTCSVYFWEVKIALYSSIIQIPFNIEEERLKEICEEACKALEDEIRQEAEKRLEKINQLKRMLYE